VTRIRLRFIQAFTAPSGQTYFYFRRPGMRRIRLRGLPGSLEFMAAYQDALAAAEPRKGIGASRNAAGTIAHLVALYAESSQFKHEIAPETRRTTWSILKRFRDEHGSKRVAPLRRAHVLSLLEDRTPFARRNWLRALRSVMNYAVNSGLIAEDPTDGLKAKLPRTEGFRPWGEEQIAAFRHRYPLGTRERLALELLLNTCQRRGDVVRMGRQDMRNGLLHVRQNKTGAFLQLPILPDLQQALAATPVENMTFLVTSRGEPLTATRFGNWFREACAVAGLRGYSAHGLRKASMRRLAEAGATPHQIAAWSGHRTLGMVAHYTRSVEQAALAREAAAKMRTPEATGELSKTVGTSVKTTKKPKKIKAKKFTVWASQASRWASSDVKARSRLCSVDLRV
jgi:integrase